MTAFLADLMSNFWVGLAGKVLLIALIVPLTALVLATSELKISAHMQHRVGPYFAGGRFGWAQQIADGIKFFQKEDIIPRDADRYVFKLAPVFGMVSTLAIFVVIPWGPGVVFRDLDLGIFFVLAVSSISVIGVIAAGWSSANKYSLIGSLRGAGQLIAYEIPLVLSVLGPVIMAGTMSLSGIVEAQIAWGLPYVVVQFVGFGIFMIAALAELNRMPFDLPIAESELTMGFVTEYSGFRFLFFFLAEYASMFALSAIGATLFLGGWYFPGMPDHLAPFLGPVVLLGKTLFLIFLMIWFRWTWPRLREDQLQLFAWKWMVPIALLNIMVTGVLKVVL